MRPINLTGQRFGRLVVASLSPSGGTPRRWLCLCDCGNRKTIAQNSLRAGRTISCGCRHAEGPSIENLSGRRFGRLQVVAQAQRLSGAVSWSCRCDCGGDAVIRGADLRSGHTQSCGCIYREAAERLNLSHGCSRVGKHTPEYRSWASMRKRCGCPTSKDFFRYGGRGIRVCDGWQTSFPQFLADMGPRPSSLHSLDRIDNDGNYEPGNCRWATAKQQANNRRNSRKAA